MTNSEQRKRWERKLSQIAAAEAMLKRAQSALAAVEQQHMAKKKWVEDACKVLQQAKLEQRQMKESIPLYNDQGDRLVYLDDEFAELRASLGDGRLQWVVESPARMKVYFRNYNRTKRSKDWTRLKVMQCRQRAIQKNLPFDLKASNLLDPRTGQLPVFCPQFPHIRLDYCGGRDRRCWASVDRIVPELGYVAGNVQVVSMAFNFWKSNGSNPQERARIVRLMCGKTKSSEPALKNLPLFDNGEP